jgi:hypothetical protein
MHRITRHSKTRAVLAVLCLALSTAGLTAEEKPANKITFKKTHLDDVFRSEGVAAGDFNHDGKLDIAAGSVYYAAPDWKMVPITAEPKQFDPKAYSDSFCNFADDINGDGWTDLIVVDFPAKQTWWFENPRTAAGPWKQHTCTPVTNNESPAYLDLDGDGKRELLFGDAQQRMAVARPGSDPAAVWSLTQIGAPDSPKIPRFYHGLGAGDVNGDGRNDVLIPQGWWEAPEDPSVGNWTFHSAPFGEACSHMYVYDFDGDGDQDVLSSSAHAFGIWWHENTGDGWKTHEIDSSFSQTHSMCLADINGDGQMDFVTGKRWWAHGGHDPGGDQPAVIYWFELKREAGRATWVPHLFDRDSGVGTQFEVIDMNGDGLLDVISANKKGVHYFEQVRP